MTHHAVALALVVAVQSVPLLAGRLNDPVVPLTPANTIITFVGTNPLASQTGRFAGFAGASRLDGAAVERSTIRLTIDMNSVVTADEALTRHLRSPDFFDAVRFATATFVSTGIRAASDGGSSRVVAGVLEMKGVRREIEAPITLQLTPQRIRAAAKLSIDRRVFNVAFQGFVDWLIRDDVVVNVTIDVERPASSR